MRVPLIVGVTVLLYGCVHTSGLEAGGKGVACSSDLDCSLNGVCSSSSATCICDDAWEGIKCDKLSLGQVRVSEAPYQGYGMSPNHTTWGGNALWWPKSEGGDDLWHLVVAEMVNNCPLSDWQKNSRCAHTVATSPEGPYEFVDVAVDVWCHNPQVVKVNATLFLLFHIGSGVPVADPANCTFGPDPDALISSTLKYHPARSMQGSTLHWSKSPAGPWVPAPPVPSCNNPAPFVHPNGTVFMTCAGSWDMFASVNILAGQWRKVGSFSPYNAPGGIHGTYEDPFLWIDQRGNWHMLYHVYNATTPCGECSGEMISGHGFSPDGYIWLQATSQPYGQTVVTTNGDTVVLATRERPKLMFDSTGKPTHLVNGVCGGASTCPPTPGVNCKFDYWDYTLINPIAS